MKKFLEGIVVFTGLIVGSCFVVLCVILTFFPVMPLMFLALPPIITGRWRWMARPYFAYHRFITETICRQKVDPFFKEWAHYKRKTLHTWGDM